MAEQEKVALMRRWFQEIWNEGRTEIVRELLAPNIVGIGTAEHDSPISSPDDFLQLVATMRGAFPDMRFTVEDAFGEGDRVCVRWSMKATHTGDHLGIAATGKPVTINGVTIVKFEDGKIVAGWDNWDQLGLLVQIGVVSPAEFVAVKGPTEAKAS